VYEVTSGGGAQGHAWAAEQNGGRMASGNVCTQGFDVSGWLIFEKKNNVE